MRSKVLYRIFDKERIGSEIFCTGFFASKKGIFGEEKKYQVLSSLREGEKDILYPRAPEQSLLNYMIMRNNIPVYNFALKAPLKERTGNSVTSTHFEEKNHILYDKGVRLTYLHYIGISAQVIKKACEGKNVEFPYRDIFLYYRRLHSAF
jgi:hypothetical protein